MAYVRNNIEEIVAGMPGVQARVRVAAYTAEGRIKAAIAPHSKTGHLLRSVKVERANNKDYWVHVTASYAVPLNSGFTHNWTGKHIAGLHFMKAAIY
jgi:hypothetical protein